MIQDASVVFPLGESAPQIWGSRGKENGLSPCAVCPHPHMGTEGLSVTQPEASPGLGTVWPLSPGQRAIWGCPRATGARGRGRCASRDAGLAGVGWGMVKGHSPLGSWELQGWAGRQPSRPSRASCWCQGSGWQGEAGGRPGGNGHLPRGYCAPSEKGLRSWNLSGRHLQIHIPALRWPTGTEAGELTGSGACSPFLVPPRAQTPRPHCSFLP